MIGVVNPWTKGLQLRLAAEELWAASTQAFQPARWEKAEGWMDGWIKKFHGLCGVINSATL